jgi:hypothetical protein
LRSGLSNPPIERGCAYVERHLEVHVMVLVIIIVILAKSIEAR